MSDDNLVQMWPAQPEPSAVVLLLDDFEEQYLTTVGATDGDVWLLESEKLFELEQRVVALPEDELREAVDLLLRFLHRLPDELPS